MADDTQKLTDKPHPMHVDSINVNTNGVSKEKGSCSESTSHEENQINIACFTTSRGNKEYGSV